MINRQGPSSTPTPTSSPTYSGGGSLINRRGPTSPPITEDSYGAWQAPQVDPNYVPVDNNPTGSLLRRSGPGDTRIASPVQIAAAQAAYVPPQQTAGAGAGNVGGGSFTKVGTGQGTFGQEQRRRLSRGPMTGLSVTPEMVRRAAMRRLG